MTEAVPLPETDSATLVGDERRPPDPVGPLFRPGSMIAERYRIVRHLASGGMGEVYEAEDTELGLRVALKAVRPDLAFHPQTLERFRREINLARQVTHRNVCRIYDFGIHGDSRDEDAIRFLTMELLHGETLSQRLKRKGPMSCEEALPLVRQILRGLRTAHQEGVVHRDFKPSNVMLEERSRGVRAVITDFGLSQQHTEATDTSRRNDQDRLTGSGQLMGTLAYIAPEQLEGEDCTTTSDLYSVGVVLYEMLTGKLPFEAPSPLLVALKRLDEAPVDPRVHCPELDERWHQALLRCLERDPARRVSSADELLRAVDPDPPPERAVPRALVAAFVAAVALATFFGVQLLPSDEPLRVAVPDPIVTGDLGDSGLLASGLQEALLRALFSLENTRPVQARENENSDLGTIAKSTAADEVIVLSVSQVSERLEYQIQRLDSNGELLGVDSFRTIIDEPKDQVAGVFASVARLFPNRSIAEAFEPTGDQWSRYVDLSYQWKNPPPRGSWEALLASVSELTSEAPEFTEALVLEADLNGYMYLQSRNRAFLDRALGAIDQVEELAPDDPRALLIGINNAIRANEFEAAEQLLVELEKSFPGEPEVYAGRGRIAWERGDLSKAREYYEKALKLWPADRYLLALNQLEIQAGRATAALGYLAKALEKQPESVFLRVQLAGLELTLGSPERAEEHYLDLVEDHPLPSTYNNLALAQLVSGKPGRAESNLRRAVEELPLNAAYNLNLADALKMQGKDEEADSYYERVLELAPRLPSDSRASVTAQALAHLGHFSEAIHLAEQVVESHPEEVDTYYVASIVYSLAGDPDRGLEFANEALNRGYSPEWFSFPWFEVLSQGQGLRTLDQ